MQIDDNPTGLPGKPLTAVQLSALNELRAACDDELSRGQSGFVRSFHLSGTKEDRSPTVKRKLMAMGLVEGVKGNPYNRQGQWLWKITEAGRERLKAEKNGGQ